MREVGLKCFLCLNRVKVLSPALALLCCQGNSNSPCHALSDPSCLQSCPLASLARLQALPARVTCQLSGPGQITCSFLPHLYPGESSGSGAYAAGSFCRTFPCQTKTHILPCKFLPNLHAKISFNFQKGRRSFCADLPCFLPSLESVLPKHAGRLWGHLWTLQIHWGRGTGTQ